MTFCSSKSMLSSSPLHVYQALVDLGFPKIAIACRHLLRPGTSPPKLVSLFRELNRGACDKLPADCAQRLTAAKANALAMAQNRVQPRFKIFFSLAPQFIPLHRQCPL